MAEDKKGFILYADIIGVIRKVTEKDRLNKTNNSGELFLHILEYVNDNNPEPINDTIDLVFEPIKMQLKRDLAKYEAIKGIRSELGRKGAEIKKQKQAIANLAKANEAVKDTDTVTDTVTVNVKDKVIDKFIPPKFEEVSEYCLERGNKVDPDKWFNHYTSNGWKVGKNKMKDWKAAIRTWEKNNFNKKETGSIDKAQQSHDEAKKLLGL